MAEEAPDRLRTPDRHDGNAFTLKIPATALGERLDRDFVARPFNEHDAARTAHLRLARAELGA